MKNIQQKHSNISNLLRLRKKHNLISMHYSLGPSTKGELARGRPTHKLYSKLNQPFWTTPPSRFPWKLWTVPENSPNLLSFSSNAHDHSDNFAGKVHFTKCYDQYLFGINPPLYLFSVRALWVHRTMRLSGTETHRAYGRREGLFTKCRRYVPLIVYVHWDY